MIALASDHMGLELKRHLQTWLTEKGMVCQDFGTHTAEMCDYPIFAALAAQAVADGRCAQGILICGTGIGMSIAANKHRGIRCALCADAQSARLSREHNDANMLALGAAQVSPTLAQDIVAAFLEAGFQGMQHEKRLAQIRALEAPPAGGEAR